MKRSKINIMLITTSLTLGSVMTACSDWNDHYDTAGVDAISANNTIWQNIKSNENLTQFASLIEKAGLTSTLDTTQTYTVWAPENGTFNYDSVNALTDKRLLNQFIENHIARNNYPATGDMTGKKVYMLNEKTMSFAGNGNYTFDDRNIKTPNVASKNGMLHIMQGNLPFNYNIYEFLSSDKYDISKIDSFYNHYHVKILDKERSLVGPIKNGQITYLDSVFNETNMLFYEYGNGIINSEDSSYTMIIPTNKAWEKAKSDLASYFNYPEKFSILSTPSDTIKGGNINSAYLKDSMIHHAILQDLIFNNHMMDNDKMAKAQSPSDFTGDSLLTINYNKFRNPDAADLLVGAHKEVLSNGTAWITDELRFKPWKTWNKIISIEGEDESVLMKLTTSKNYVAELNPTSRPSVTLSNQNPAISGTVSGNRYLVVNPRTATTKPDVYFKIPEVLSTTYCVFLTLVPENITNTFITEPLKDTVEVRIGYHRANGNAPAQAKAMDNTMGSSLTSVKTSYLGDFTFETAYQGLEDIYPYIRIRSRANTSNGYTNTLRIDAIYLVPRDLVDYIQTHPEYKEEALKRDRGLSNWTMLPLPIEDAFK